MSKVVIWFSGWLEYFIIFGETPVVVVYTSVAKLTGRWIFFFMTSRTICLTLSWRRPISYRNQSTDLRSKSMDWFLYDNGLSHDRVKSVWHLLIWRTLEFEGSFCLYLLNEFARMSFFDISTFFSARVNVSLLFISSK